MNWVGVCLVSNVTALGVGSTRDILLYLLITAVAALMTIATARIVDRLRNVFLGLDAISLSLFTIIGCNVALDLDLPFLVVIMSSMITGCIGGVLSDVLRNDILLLFRNELTQAYQSLRALFTLAGSVWVTLVIR